MEMSYYKSLEPFWGTWRIAKELGQGAYGKVFEIVREDYGEYAAALKIITIPQSDSEWQSLMADGMDEVSATAYFQAFVNEISEEIALMSRLKGHSHIVSYEDHCVLPHSDGRGWDILIRMELLTPFISMIPNDRSTDRDKVIKLGIDICKALESCQMQKIVHRDIKPENIMVSRVGDYKLGDFGIARTVEKTTGAMSKKGTYTYMAPEVYKGEKYDATVDLYSLGIVLYRLLNRNRAPFMPPYPQEIRFNDRENALERRFKGEEIPLPVDAQDALGRVILKACAYHKEDRFQSATEMRLALENPSAFVESLVQGQVPRNINDIPIKTEAVEQGGIQTEPTSSVFCDIPNVSVDKDPAPAQVEGNDLPPASVQNIFVAQTEVKNASKKSKIGIVFGIVAAFVLFAIIIGVIIGLRNAGDSYSASERETLSSSTRKETPTPTPRSTTELDTGEVVVSDEVGNSVEKENTAAGSLDFDALYDAAEGTGEIFIDSISIVEGDSVGVRFYGDEWIVEYATDLYYESSDESIAVVEVTDNKQGCVVHGKKHGTVTIRGVYDGYKASIDVTVVENAYGVVQLQELYDKGYADSASMSLKNFGEAEISLNISSFLEEWIGENVNDMEMSDYLNEIGVEKYYTTEDLQLIIKSSNASGKITINASGWGVGSGKGEITMVVLDKSGTKAMFILRIPVEVKG